VKIYNRKLAARISHNLEALGNLHLSHGPSTTDPAIRAAISCLQERIATDIQTLRAAGYDVHGKRVPGPVAPKEAL